LVTNGFYGTVKPFPTLPLTSAILPAKCQVLPFRTCGVLNANDQPHHLALRRKNGAGNGKVGKGLTVP